MAALSTPLDCLRRAWRGREQFVVLLQDIAAAALLPALLQAWRDDTQRCERLHIIGLAIDGLDAARNALSSDSPTRPEAASLLGAWPVATPGFHRMALESGTVQLLLLPGPARDSLSELSAQVDAFWLSLPGGLREGVGSLRAWSRLSAAGAQVIVSRANLLAEPDRQTLLKALRSQGFQIPGLPAEQRDGLLARYEPQFTPRRAASRPLRAASSQRRTLIVGAGLAGTACAWALAERGWHSSVFERREAPALESSGNPGGLFHGIVNGQDGSHARFNRAAALEASRAVDWAIREAGAAGSAAGLLRLESSFGSVSEMRALLMRLGLPASYVQALAADAARDRSGLPLSQSAWFYPQGGWVRPGDLVKAYLLRAGSFCTLRAEVAVHSLRREGPTWQLLDREGALIDEAEVLLLCNASDALRLLPTLDWPLTRTRGQISWTRPSHLPASARLPVAGMGYLLPESDGKVAFGATTQTGDEDASVRQADHLLNLAQLSRMTGWRLDAATQNLAGRTAWRCVAPDRLPLIGAVPSELQVAAQSEPGAPERFEHPRQVPRMAGLYVFTALGSRGITWSALGAQCVASAIAGTPSPLENSLLDAVDPARFAVRRMRRSG